MKNFLILVPLAGAMLFGCNYNRIKETGSAKPNDALKMLGRLDFSMVQASVLGPKCLRCHNSNRQEGGANLETYSQVRALMPRIVFRSLGKMDMPPDQPLSNDEMTILKSWFDNGAPEKYVDGNEKVDPNLEMGPVDWTKIRDKVFAAKCFDCHSPPNPEKALDLTSYLEVKSKAAVIFDRVIIKQDMPLEPYPTLSPVERRVLLNWFNSGMPN